MKTYNLQGQGCLVLAIIAIILFSIMTFFGRILFTTPIGIALLIGFGIKYLIDSTKKSRLAKQSQYEFTNDSSQSYSESGSSNTVDNGTFSRDDYVDAEEITDYKEVDK